jgi:hypothetical protein
VRGWRPPHEDTLDWCVRKSAEAYNAEAQAIIEQQEAEILRLGALYEDVAREAAMFKDELTKIRDLIISETESRNSSGISFFIISEAGYELKRWLEEREKE